jgi:inner membrane transporter RhtA
MSSSSEHTDVKNTDFYSTTNVPTTDGQFRGKRWQGLTHKVPAQVLALLAIVLMQMGAAVGKGLFAAIGPLGTTFLRLGFAAVLLLVIWRPQIRGLTRAQYVNVLDWCRIVDCTISL